MKKKIVLSILVVLIGLFIISSVLAANPGRGSYHNKACEHASTIGIVHANNHSVLSSCTSLPHIGNQTGSRNR